MATIKKNTAGVFYWSLWNANSTAYQVNPTLAIGDVKVDLDGVSLGNITTLPVVVPVGSNTIKVVYSASEVNGDDVVFKFVDAAGSEWQTVNVLFKISVENLDGIDARIPSSLLNGRMQSNVDAISDDAIAASNLELQYDGTGLSGDTFPSTQNQLSSIANVGSATHKPSSSYVLTTGTQTANLFSDTESLNAVRHTHSDSAGVLELYYQFIVGSGIPASVQVTGFLNSNNDDIDVFGFDWVSSTWKQIGNIEGSNQSTNSVYSFDMFVDMVGSGSNKGIIRVRFFNASGLSSALLAIDQIFVAFAIGLDGYEGGAIWFDDAAINTGTEVGIDGTSRNSVSTPAAVESLLVSTGLHRVHIAPGSTYTMATDHSNREVFGQEWFLGLGGQTINGAHFSGCTVTGIGVGTVRCSFHNGAIGTTSLPICDVFDCIHPGKLTVTSAGTYNFFHSAHATDSGAFQLEYGATVGSTIIHNHGYEGAITIANMGTVGTDVLHLSGNGKVTFEASCVTGGTANVFGFEVVDSSGVGFVINSSGNINTQISAIPTTPMRGTNSVPLNPALATDYTSARAAKLDNLDALISSRNAVTPNTVTPPTVAAIRTEIDANSTKLSEVTPARMSELDAATGGKMANQIDLVKVEADKIASRATQTSLDTKIPTNLSFTGTDLHVTLDGETVKLSALTHTGAVIPTISTLSGHTPQTGDTFAQIPANFSDLAISITTGRVTSGIVSDKSGYQLSVAGVNDIIRTALTEGYAADGANPTVEQFMFMIWSMLSEFAIAGTTITAKKKDGVTTSMTFTTDSATDPTSITRAT